MRRHGTSPSATGDEKLKERLRFEEVLSEISTSLINLLPEQIERVIQDSQQRLFDCLDIDRSTLWQVDKKVSVMLLNTCISLRKACNPLSQWIQGLSFHGRCRRF